MAPTASHCTWAQGQIVHPGKCRGGLPGQIKIKEKVCCAFLKPDYRLLVLDFEKNCLHKQGQVVARSNCRVGQATKQKCCLIPNLGHLSSGPTGYQWVDLSKGCARVPPSYCKP